MALQDEQAYYKEHFEKICSNYVGKFIVIYEKQLVGHFDTFKSAYEDAVQRFGDAPFFITQVLKDQPLTFLAYAG